MPDTAAIYRFEFRGTIELPTQVLLQNRRGTLQQAIDLCNEYSCQILLRDDDDAAATRGLVRPNGQHDLT